MILQFAGALLWLCHDWELGPPSELSSHVQGDHDPMAGLCKPQLLIRKVGFL